MFKMIKTITLLTLLMVLTACGTGEDSDELQGTASADGTDVPAEITELTIMTHDSFDISEEVLNDFEEAHNTEVIVLRSGDAGSALNQAILTKDNPLADLFYGVDNTFMTRAMEEEIFQPYQSPLLENIPDELELDSSYHMLPVDYGDVCLNYDKEYFAESDIESPDMLGDLVDPAYAGLTVVENPATSSPGLAFLLATIGTFGTDDDYDYLDYWLELKENDVLITDGWEDAYWGQFSGASDGDRPIVVSYATSPPAEVVFADPPIDEPPTAAVTAPQTCFRQVEFVGILKGTEHADLARAFVDFMLGPIFQADIPLKMFVYPVNETVDLPELFVQWGGHALEPVEISAEEIAANRDAWIQEWTETILR